VLCGLKTSCGYFFCLCSIMSECIVNTVASTVGILNTTESRGAGTFSYYNIPGGLNKLEIYCL